MSADLQQAGEESNGGKLDTKSEILISKSETNSNYSMLLKKIEFQATGVL